MIELLVIADDLTGAADTGVQFAKNRISTAVTDLDSLNDDALWSDFSVLVVNTSSRHSTPEDSALKVKRVCKAAAKRGVKAFYKKTDSTLRGNIGAELQSFLRSAGRERVMFIPGFPDAGRIVKNGCLFVNDIPLQETSFNSDPLNPVDTNYLPDILRKQTDLPLYSITTGEMDILFSDLFDRRGIFIFDSTSNDDLKEICSVLQDASSLDFCAGPAGFASFLAQCSEIKRSTIKSQQLSPGLLVVNGSLNSVSLRQIRNAAADGVKCFSIDDSCLNSVAAPFCLEDIVGELKENKTVLLTSALDMNDRINQDKIHLKIGDQIGSLTKKILERSGEITITLFGGDTAHSVYQSLGCTHIVPVAEPISGLTLCSAFSAGKCIPFISKSGGFGGPALISELQQVLRTRPD